MRKKVTCIVGGGFSKSGVFEMDVGDEETIEELLERMNIRPEELGVLLLVAEGLGTKKRIGLEYVPENLDRIMIIPPILGG